MHYLLLFISCLFGLFEQDRGEFYDQVLAFDRGHDAFLVVTLQARDSTVQTVMQNSDLYYHLRQERKCRSVLEYQTLVKEALVQRKPLPMTYNLNFYHVARFRKCPSDLYTTEDDLDRYFLLSGVIREGYQDYIPCLIRELFEHQIITAINPANGYFYYVQL